MVSATRKQDLPPEGGYKSILYARNPAKTYFSGAYSASVSECTFVCLCVFTVQSCYCADFLYNSPVPSGAQCIAAYLGITGAGLYVYYLTHKEITRDAIEMRSGRHAILPLLLAERDREYLKQIRRNRDEEANLMANVADWKVGTWYGEPIYKTKPADKFYDPSYKEFYGQTSFAEFAQRAHLKLWS